MDRVRILILAGERQAQSRRSVRQRLNQSANSVNPCVSPHRIRSRGLSELLITFENEPPRQQFTESHCFRRRVAGLRQIVQQDQHLRVEFMEKLAACSARHGDAGQGDADGLDLTMTGSDGRTHRDSFCTDGQSVRSILHVAAGKDFTR